jgi:hypothetical protein
MGAQEHEDSPEEIRLNDDLSGMIHLAPRKIG